jgi:hypothetical protein
MERRPRKAKVASVGDAEEEDVRMGIRGRGELRPRSSSVGLRRRL